jgi:hypothetical protein
MARKLAVAPVPVDLKARYEGIGAALTQSRRVGAYALAECLPHDVRVSTPADRTTLREALKPFGPAGALALRVCWDARAAGADTLRPVVYAAITGEPIASYAPATDAE